MKSPTGWRKYQRQVADVFRSIGFAAVEDATVGGVRGLHDVDVLVTFEAFGRMHTWVVECKDRSRRVEKLHVLVLQAVVADVGADHGFLLSESGFQSGAHRVSRMSNVSLCSLKELRVEAESALLRWYPDRRGPLRCSVSEFDDNGNMEASAELSLTSADGQIDPRSVELVVFHGERSWRLNMASVSARVAPRLTFDVPWDLVRLGMLDSDGSSRPDAEVLALSGKEFRALWLTPFGPLYQLPFSYGPFK